MDDFALSLINELFDIAGSESFFSARNPWFQDWFKKYSSYLGGEISPVLIFGDLNLENGNGELCFDGLCEKAMAEYYPHYIGHDIRVINSLLPKSGELKVYKDICPKTIQESPFSNWLKMSDLEMNLGLIYAFPGEDNHRTLPRGLGCYVKNGAVLSKEVIDKCRYTLPIIYQACKFGLLNNENIEMRKSMYSLVNSSSKAVALLGKDKKVLMCNAQFENCLKKYDDIFLKQGEICTKNYTLSTRIAKLLDEGLKLNYDFVSRNVVNLSQTKINLSMSVLILSSFCQSMMSFEPRLAVYLNEEENDPSGYKDRILGLLCDTTVTRTELEIIYSLCKGMTVNEIAEIRNVNTDTISKQISSIKGKLRVETRERLSVLINKLIL